MFGMGKSKATVEPAAMPAVPNPADAQLSARLESAAAAAMPAAAPPPPAVSDPPAAGVPAGVAPAQEPGQSKRAAIVSGEISHAVGSIVRVLMQTRHGKHFALADLEWLVLPAVASGQFRLAEMASESGAAMFPAAVVIWASVSPEVDQRLSANPEAPVRLRPDEWTSGDIIWLIEASGHPKVTHSLLEQLAKSFAPGRQIKMRKNGPVGKMTIGTLS